MTEKEIYTLLDKSEFEEIDEAIVLALQKMGDEERTRFIKMVDQFIRDIKTEHPRVQLSRGGVIELFGKIGMSLLCPKAYA